MKATMRAIEGSGHGVGSAPWVQGMLEAMTDARSDDVAAVLASEMAVAMRADPAVPRPPGHSESPTQEGANSASLRPPTPLEPATGAGGSGLPAEETESKLPQATEEDQEGRPGMAALARKRGPGKKGLAALALTAAASAGLGPVTSSVAAPTAGAVAKVNASTGAGGGPLLQGGTGGGSGKAPPTGTGNPAPAARARSPTSAAPKASMDATAEMTAIGKGFLLR